MAEKRLELIDNHEMEDIVGYVPRALIRWSIAMAFVVVLLLIVGSWLFVYPEVTYGSVSIPQSSGHATVVGVAYFPAYRSGMIKEGGRVDVSLENFPEEHYGTLSGKISHVYAVPTNEGLYRVDILFDKGLITSRGIRLNGSMELCGQAGAVLAERRLIEYIFGMSSLNFDLCGRQQK